MKSKLFVLMLMIRSLFAQSEVNQLLPPSSVAVTDNALSIFANPAALGYRSGFQSFVLLPFEENGFTNEFGAYYMIGNLGFGGEWLKNPEGFYQRWHLSLGVPVWRWVNIGGTYRWFGTVEDNPEYDFGAIARPFPWISIGSVIRNIGEANNLPQTGEFGIGLRPFGKRFTIAGDICVDIQNSEKEVSQKFYVDFEPIRGIILSTLYFPDEKDLRLGLNVNMLSSGVGLSLFNKSGDGLTGGSAFIHSTSHRYPTVFKKKGALVLKMNIGGMIQEETIPFSRGKTNSLKGILDRFKQIEKNPDIQAVLIGFQGLEVGFAKMTEIRNAILGVRESGKKVFCYMESFGNGGYYLATACDKIFLNPAGDVWVTGLISTAIFFKDMFDKIGVEAEFEKIGAYKSAPESFIRDSMSEASREQINALLDDFFSVYVESVSKARNMKIDEVKDLINNGPYTAPQALEKGLVDELVYQDEIKDKLKDILGKKPIIKEFKKEYKRKPYETAWKYSTQPTSKIALIYASGGISSGKNRKGFGSQTMGSETIAKAIRKAREDKSVKAIVFRIDSPGGSALASDVIWREVYLTTTGEDKKPFIVSMSDVAASGGYYIACAADTIVANPLTITGSIGVFGGKFNFAGLLDKIGVNTETIKRGDNADLLSPFKAGSEEERKKMRDYIGWIYDDFTKHVADGRGMTQDEVKKVGEGRVWSGVRAKKIGLVDELGGLTRALEIAKEAAGIEKDKEVMLKILPKWWHSFIEIGFSTFYSKELTFERLLPTEYKQAKMYFNTWLMNCSENAHMIMPYWIIID